MPLENGTILDKRYRIIKLLGKGGMGNVYLVERTEIDIKKFVIKELLLPLDINKDEAINRFYKEAEFMSKFNHRGIPKMYGVFSQDGKYYLRMEYIEGETLEDIINSSNNPVSLDRAIEWTIEIADIMDYLHNTFHTPIIYRDLKPSNIIITPDGKTKLVDFGIARYYNPNKDTDTISLGSPGYAAPEQYRGRGQSNPQSDIYGLGVILFQMITKYDPTVRPFNLPDIKSLNPSIDKKLEIIINKAIQLDPLKRYISMRDFKENLEKYIISNIMLKDTILKKTQGKLPNKYGIIGKGCSLASLSSALIFILAGTNGIAPGKDYLYIMEFLLTIMFISPIAGMIFAIIGLYKSLKNKNIDQNSSNNALWFNILFFILLLFFASIFNLLHILSKPFGII